MRSNEEPRETLISRGSFVQETIAKSSNQQERIPSPANFAAMYCSLKTRFPARIAQKTALVRRSVITIELGAKKYAKPVSMVIGKG